MKVLTIETQNGNKADVTLYFSQEFKGRGGWNITCEVSFKSETKKFRNYTTDSIFIDEISNMKADDASFDEIQNAYYEHSFHKMEEEVAEWIEEILTEENED
jgi:hypothetical protein